MFEKKKVEYRDIKDYYISRFVNLGVASADEDMIYVDSEKHFLVNFRAGYNKGVPEMLVETHLIFCVFDENGNEVCDENPSDDYYWTFGLVIDKIIETKNMD